MAATPACPPRSTWSFAARRTVALRRDGGNQAPQDVEEGPAPDGASDSPLAALLPGSKNDPDFDNLPFSYADRRRIIAEEHRAVLFGGNTRCTMFLVDGFVGGRWKVERRQNRARLLIEPVSPLAYLVRQALEEERKRLMCWMLDEKMPFEIQFSHPLPEASQVE